MKAYKHSLEVAVEEFQTQRNAAGIAAILFEIPTRFFYWDVLGTTWNALVAVSKKFLDHESLRLATLPEKFGLVRPGARQVDSWTETVDDVCSRCHVRGSLKQAVPLLDP